MLRLTFPPEIAAGISDEEKKLAFVLMGRTIQSAIRVCDSAYRISDDEVLLIMPDTAKSGAKIVISRLHTSLKQALTVECPNLSKAVLNNVDIDYIGGSDLPQYDKILDELVTLLYRTNPELKSVNPEVMEYGSEASV